MFPERVVQDGSLRPTDDGLTFDIRMPWYRALPWSCIDLPAVAVNGAPVPREAVTVSVDGADLSLDDLATRYDEYWHVTDPARIRLRGNDYAHVDEVDLTVTISARIPYIIVVGSPITVHETCTKTLKLAERSAS